VPDDRRYSHGSLYPEVDVGTKWRLETYRILEEGEVKRDDALYVMALYQGELVKAEYIGEEEVHYDFIFIKRKFLT